MERTLITSGTSAFSQRVAKLFPEEDLFFGDSRPIPAPFIKSGRYIPIPSPEKASFVHEILKVCLDHSITKLLPLNEEELMPLAKNNALFEEYGITILVPKVVVLDNIPRLINPTRANCVEIIIKQSVYDKSGISGVFKVGDQGELILCCLNKPE